MAGGRNGRRAKYYDDLVVVPLGVQSEFGTADRYGAAPYEVTFVADPVGQVVTYTWDFGDGSAPSVTIVPTETHAYTKAGAYDVDSR